MSQKIFTLRINQLFTRAKDRDHKLTLKEYAEYLGTTVNSLRGWLAGTGEPNSDKMRYIAEIEQVSVDWLVGVTDISEPPIYLEDVTNGKEGYRVHGSPSRKKIQAIQKVFEETQTKTPLTHVLKESIAVYESLSEEEKEKMLEGLAVLNEIYEFKLTKLQKK